MSGGSVRVRDGALGRARAVRLVAMDVDGVLTDGRLLIGPKGEEWKSFDARDGLGLRFAREAGLRLGIISGRRSSAVERRAAELKLDEVHQGVVDKLRVFEAILARQKLSASEVAFVGDDFVDLPVLLRSGFSAVVPDAPEELLARADLVTGRHGGQGAVREVIEYILRAQGLWEGIVGGYSGAVAHTAEKP